MWKELLQGGFKLFLLGCARKCAKRPTAVIETSAVMLVLQQYIAHKDQSQYPSPAGLRGSPLYAAARYIFLPAAIIKSVRLTRRLLGRTKEPPKLKEDPVIVSTEGVVVACPPFKPNYPPLPKPLSKAASATISTAEAAAMYSEWIRLLDHVLPRHGVEALPEGWDVDGLELARFLLFGPIFKAQKANDGLKAVSQAVQKVRATLAWRSKQTFMTPEELEGWRDMIWVHGPDASGFIWLHLHMGRAVERAQSGGRGAGQECVRAVMSQMEHIVRHLMVLPIADGTMPQDRLKVLVIGSGTNVRKALRLTRLLRQLAVLVFRHHPARLKSLQVVALPGGLRLGAAGIMALIPGDTRCKIKICKIEDLPDGVAAALAAQEQAWELEQARQAAARPASLATPPAPSAAEAAHAWLRRAHVAALMAVIAALIFFAQHVLEPHKFVALMRTVVGR